MLGACMASICVILIVLRAKSIFCSVLLIMSLKTDIRLSVKYIISYMK